MLYLDLAELDRRVAATAIELRRRARALGAPDMHVGGEADDAIDVHFPRDVSTRAIYDELAAVSGDPLAQALRSWIAHLTIERVTSADVVRLARARVQPVQLSSGTSASVNGLVLELFGVRAEERAKQLEEAASAVADGARWLAERRAEAERLLDRSTEAIAARRLERTRVEDAARRLLAMTDGGFHAEPPPTSWSLVVRRALAMEAGEGWPSRISTRWLADGFRGGSLFAGVALDVGMLPEPRGAASFARAFAQVGEALALVDRPPAAPFSLLRAPGDSVVAARAALFAGLVVEPAFHERKLGLGRDRARVQARTIARASVVWLRLAALRVLAWPLLLASSGQRDFQDLSEHALGIPLPGALLGVFPKLDPGDGSALGGAVAAALHRERLRDEFDEDWFDNPRAHEAMRHEHHQPLSAREPPPAPFDDQHWRAFEQRIGEALGA